MLTSFKEPLQRVEIGHLPRPAPGISVHDSRSIPWVLPNESTIMTPPNQRELEEVYIPEEDRLFDSDSDSSESTESASRLNDISNQVTAEEVQVNSFPSISSRLTRNQLQEFGDILQRLRGLTTGLERATSRLQPFILRLSEGGAQQSGLAELRDQARSMEALLMNQARWITDVVSQRNPQEQRMQVDSRLHEFEFGVQRESRARQFEPDRDSLRQHYARVFGTVEDVQRSDYESPISRMFDRQWERLRAAREMTGEMLTRPGPDHSTSNQPLSRPNEVLIATTSQITDQQGRLDDSMPTADAIFTNMQNVVNSMRTSRQDPNNKNRARLIDSLLPPPENSLTEEQMHIKLQCTICLEQVADIALVPCGECSSTST